MVIKHWLQLSSNTIKGAFLQGPIHPDLLGVAAGHQRVPSKGWLGRASDANSGPGQGMNEIVPL